MHERLKDAAMRVESRRLSQRNKMFGRYKQRSPDKKSINDAIKKEELDIGGNRRQVMNKEESRETGRPRELKCFNCGEVGHKSRVCKKAPGQIQWLDLQGGMPGKEGISFSNTRGISNSVCKFGEKGVAKVAVVNTSAEPLVFSNGQEVGDWEGIGWEEIGKISAVTHDIDVRGHEAHPPEYTSNTKWASPVVLVRKKNGSLRLCIDYRQLNKCTKHDAYSLPGIDVMLQSLQGERFFRTLDMASGYWQIPLSETAKKKLLMDTVLRDLKDKEVFVYIDDILIATETEERHYEVTQKVIEALLKANLRSGHMIDSSGVHNCARRIILTTQGNSDNYPGTSATGCGGGSIWSESVYHLFRRIICGYRRCTMPARKGWLFTTHLFHVDAPIEVTEELSCDRPRGACLGGRAEKIPLFRLRTEGNREDRSCPLEALALVAALKKFLFFVYGLRVIVRTDHVRLTALFKRTNVSGRVLRWALDIQQYRLEIEYVKGKANAVADALSRGILVSANVTAETCPGDEQIVCKVTTHQDSEWLVELRKDVNYGPVITALENEELDKDVRLSGSQRRLKEVNIMRCAESLCFASLLGWL
ncbi:unnamed protein product [Nippostrongylus brasiliensis]|uniref:CCHC-type domain-containing protein n=1 Tax=Nippostrongylus brasiliensis TaxID=27835 RepID=A0A0N4YVT6_NIPBR|nr:unnamed protein product [Nippostrongylus brasiliensis]